MRNNLDMASLVLQIYNLILLMQELQTQDEVYLKTIIQQNEKIIELLTKGSDENGT